MRKLIIPLILTLTFLATPVLLAGQNTQQARLESAFTTTMLYDDFNQMLINPALWNTYCSWAAMSQECVIAIQNGKLRLARRISGLRDGDTGFQWGGASANFTSPLSITSIRADVVVQKVWEQPCPANPEYGGNANVFASFFNDGSGDPNMNLGAQLIVGHGASDSDGQLSVFAQMMQGVSPLQTISLGTVSMRTPITMIVRWDRPNKRFIMSWTNNVTHQTTIGNIPYNVSDATPAVNPANGIGVNEFPANCTANSTWVYVESVFDNVDVGR